MTLPLFVLGQGGYAQENELAVDSTDADSDNFATFRIAPTSVLSEAVAPLIEIARKTEARDLHGNIVEDALNFNLGMQITPIRGLEVNAGVWQQEIVQRLQSDGQMGSAGNLSQLYIEDSSINEFNIDDPALGQTVKSKGFDIGASYVWDTNRFGQFTLSTKTTYVREFQNRGSLLELFGAGLDHQVDRAVSPELQSSLMLTWQFGNHTASAITNYFDSFKDINDLDLDEINALVDNIATVDLQYGYTVNTGNDDRAIISFGIRNIFNEKTVQLLNSNTQILDQNGRVAYGSIKYQF
tara:strand:- start:197 stop:1087 length:891 start_codon:yes stop_codon:yes gene_type:complete